MLKLYKFIRIVYYKYIYLFTTYVYSYVYVLNKKYFFAQM